MHALESAPFDYEHDCQLEVHIQFSIKRISLKEKKVYKYTRLNTKCTHLNTSDYI
ncbi:MAG: hypothetical protein ACTSQJ_02715 [Promethearchaeota archaeon]